MLLRLVYLIVDWGCCSVVDAPSVGEGLMLSADAVNWRNAAPGIGGFHSCLHTYLNYVDAEWLARLLVSLTTA
ncbi:hypothetical protein Nepgr_006791 [Nepenthes gracilis]|uniref:Secreted protein n=1 Tax=Nepenthes gracilis TaxID=150966 RepID=A0AAD3XHX9_NEPGR|nr:hypothetical protein Nepgr_006791 [Nepenthes gracilis]